MPALDLNRLAEGEVHAPVSSSRRSLFERQGLHELSGKIKAEEVDMSMYPEMLKMREDAIRYREETEHKYMERMFK